MHIGTCDRTRLGRAHMVRESMLLDLSISKGAPHTYRDRLGDTQVIEKIFHACRRERGEGGPPKLAATS